MIINGGHVEAVAMLGSGIGGGTYNGLYGGSATEPANTTLTVNGGYVYADSGMESPAIGGGGLGSGMNVVINGGQVLAGKKASGGVGIGSGLVSNDPNVTGGTLTITGGTVIAYGDSGVSAVGVGSKDTAVATITDDIWKNMFGKVNLKGVEYNQFDLGRDGNHKDNGRYVFSYDASTGEINTLTDFPTPSPTPSPDPGPIPKTDTIVNKNELNIQAGALSGQAIKLSLVNATAKTLGIKDPAIDVTSFKAASDAMERLGNALDIVSTYRATFGAQQNRLEAAMRVDDNSSENTSAAESRIRDTDMSKEMVYYSMQTILMQAGQSMLTQANGMTQGVLELLR